MMEDKCIRYISSELREKEETAYPTKYVPFDVNCLPVVWPFLVVPILPFPAFKVCPLTYLHEFVLFCLALDHAWQFLWGNRQYFANYLIIERSEAFSPVRACGEFETTSLPPHYPSHLGTNGRCDVTIAYGALIYDVMIGQQGEFLNSIVSMEE